jgi:hypothetical protein
MLAEMDSRLQLLQQELESVAVPIARRGSEPRRPARRPDGDTLAALGAEHQAHDDVQVMEPEPPPLAAERPARAPRALTRAPRSPRPSATEPAPGPAPFEEARMAEEARTAAELLPAPRPRAGRRGPAVARTRPSAPLEETPRRIPPTIAAAPPPAPSQRPLAPPPPPAAAPVARSSASEAVVRQTILEAEEEARRVVDNARDRIAEIGARTRALLEHSLGAAPEPDPEMAPAPTRRRRAAPAPRATPQQRSYHGAVTVEAGPFADVGQLDEFEDALASVPGIEDVYIRTFERYYAHFELSIAEPTALIAELQARVPEQLRLIDAGDRELRLEIVRGDADRTPRA